MTHAFDAHESDSKTRLRLWLGLLKISRGIEAELRENLRSEFDSTLPQFDVMAALRRFEAGLRMSELSSVLKVSNGNVTGIVDRLAAEGLVERIPVPDDRRMSRVRLTAKGRRQFDKQARAHERWVNDLLGGFDSTEAEHLLASFKSLAGARLVTEQRDASR